MSFFRGFHSDKNEKRKKDSYDGEIFNSKVQFFEKAMKTYQKDCFRKFYGRKFHHVTFLSKVEFC